ncbi:MAG: hypothetical protein RIM80_17695 [Alphaproteobacteria bacterium]
MQRNPRKPLEEVIVELQPYGAYVKATAIDPVTGVEVSIVGDAAAPTKLLQQAAARKLQYVLENKKGAASPARGLVV